MSLTPRQLRMQNIRSLKADISISSEPPDKREALLEVSQIWSMLDECAGLAEARMRILINQLPRMEIELAEFSSGMGAMYLQVHSFGECPHPAAVNTAFMLVRACLAESQSNHEHPLTLDDIQITPGVFGRCSVNWMSVDGTRLGWMVEASPLPWPGVTVLSTSSIQPPTVFHTAFELIEQWSEVFSSRNKEPG